MLFENQIGFHLDHFVFTFGFKIWGKDSELFYLNPDTHGCFMLVFPV